MEGALLTICSTVNAGLLNEHVVPQIKKLNPACEFRIENPPGHFLNISHNEVVLFMGGDYVKEAQRRGYVPKNRTLESMRETVFPVGNGGKFLFSYSPGILYTSYKERPKIQWDITLAERVHRTGSIEPQVGEYTYVDDFSAVVEYVNSVWETTQKPCDVCLDLETMGFYPYYPDKEIVTISLTVAPGVSDIVYVRKKWDEVAWKRFLAQVKFLLTSPKVKLIGANLKFDLIWIRQKWKIVCTNFTFDTLLAGSLLDENRSNSLNSHAKEFLPLGGYDDTFNEEQDKGHMERIKPEDLRVYAGGDTDAAYQVAQIFRRQLAADSRVARLYVKIVHPACRVFERVEETGLHVDLDKFKILRDDVQKEMFILENKALGLMPAKLRHKYRDDLKLTKPALLKEFLFSPAGLNLKPKMTSEKTGEPSVAKDHLSMFVDDPVAHEFIEVLEQYNRASKVLSTYIDGFLAHLRPTGRFHPTYMLFNGSVFGDDDKEGGTVTGRLSAKDPAVQTLPKHAPKTGTNWSKRLRECYTAPPGYKMWQCDFSQGELRIAACLANEDTMLEAYAQDKDLHAVTGSKLAGVEFTEFMEMKKTHPDLFDGFRQKAKPANFGLLYGMGAEGYQEYARKSYGQKMSIEEAVAQRNAFFDLYCKLLPWHDTYKGMAHKAKGVYSPLGRLRHLPLIGSKNGEVRSRAERQAINSPVQSCLSDLCLWSMVRIEEQLSQYGVIIAGMTHDSCYGYVPEQDSAILVGRIRDVMESLPIKEEFMWDHQIPFPVDAELGDSFASMVKQKR